MWLLYQNIGIELETRITFVLICSFFLSSNVGKVFIVVGALLLVLFTFTIILTTVILMSILINIKAWRRSFLDFLSPIYLKLVLQICFNELNISDKLVIRCNEHGQCKNGTCLCVTGWNGKHCTQEGCPNTCSGHGQCRVNADSLWECRCSDGWDGRDCSVLLEQNCNDGRDNDKGNLHKQTDNYFNLNNWCIQQTKTGQVFNFELSKERVLYLNLLIRLTVFERGKRKVP